MRDIGKAAVYLGLAEKVSGASDTRRQSEDVSLYFELKPTR